MSNNIQMCFNYNFSNLHLLPRERRRLLGCFLFNNDYTYYIKYEMHNKFFSYKAKGFFSYLQSSHQNKIFDHFTSKICCLNPDKINLYPILLWDEITNITNLKKEHDFLVLDNKFKHKLKTKSLKI